MDLTERLPEVQPSMDQWAHTLWCLWTAFWLCFRFPERTKTKTDEATRKAPSPFGARIHLPQPSPPVMGNTYASLFPDPRPALNYDRETRSPLLNLPPEVWGVITSYFGHDGTTLRSMMMTSRSTHALLCSPKAITRLHINLSLNSRVRIEEWPTPWFTKFPGLTSLGLRLGPSSSVKVDANVLASFPQFLRHLHFGFVDSISDSLVPLLPAFLETLHLEHNSRISNAGIQNLPESLTSLHLPNNYLLTPTCLPHIPRAVTSLSIRTSEAITEPLMVTLPPLKFLTLEGSQPPGGPAIAALPATLQSLVWNFRRPLEALELSLLPTALQELTCSISRDPSTLQDRSLLRTLEALPRGLHSLCILTGPTVYLSEDLAGLPKGLRSLELRSDKYLSTTGLTHLPNSLKALILPKHDSFLASDFLNLPKALETLKLPSNGRLSNAALAVLPTSLHFFSCLWTPESFTEDCVKYAQPSLTRLELKAQFIDDLTQPIDAAFPNARTLPRYTRERSSQGYLSSFSPWDYHTFTLNPLAMTIEQTDINPRPLNFEYQASAVAQQVRKRLITHKPR